MQRGSSSPSMIDVAKHAGVSQSTVSYVLSGSRPISDEVRGRVEKAIRELHYAPRAAARALRGGATHTLALSVPDDEGVRDAWLGLYLLRLTLAAQQRGYDLLVTAESTDAARVLEEIALGQRADGAILMSVTDPDPRIAVAKETGFPTVALGEPGGGEIPFVDFDFRGAATMAISHLASNGHRSIVYVGPKEAERSAGYLYVERVVSGMRDAAKQHGMTVHEFYPTSNRSRDATTFATFLDARRDISGMVLTSSFTNFELLRSEFLRLRPSATEGTDVVAFGTSGLAGDYDSAGARIVNPIDTLATATVDALLDQIAGRAAVSRLVAPQLVVEPRDDLALRVGIAK